MTIPSEFALLHYRKKIDMHTDCTIDLISKLLIIYMVFVSDIQNPSKALHLKGFYHITLK